MAKHITHGKRRMWLENFQSSNVVSADTTARVAKEEIIKNKLKAKHEIEKIVKSGVERRDSLEKIRIKCSVLQNILGYDPENFVKKLYYEYIKEKDNGHEER